MHRKSEGSAQGKGILMTAIEMRGLTKRYRDMTAVEDFSLKIEEGELFALLGVNGAGKSTTIKMLCGLVRPTCGDAFLMGKSIVTELSQAKHILGVSPQETAVAPNLSVRENLVLIAGLYGAGRSEAQTAASTMIERFSMGEIERKRAGRLSGGWQRRLSIAMALISKPKVLFLDEPTLGLDVLARRELWKLIESLHGQVTVILTTHYLEEAEALADRVGILSRGRLVACGTAAQLKHAAGAETFEDAFVKLSERGGNV